MKWGGVLGPVMWPILIPLGLMLVMGVAGIALVGTKAIWGIVVGSFVYFGPAAIVYGAFRSTRTRLAWMVAGGPAIAFACVQAAILLGHMGVLFEWHPFNGLLSWEDVDGALLLLWSAFAVVVVGGLNVLVLGVPAVRRWRRPYPGVCPKCNYNRTGLPTQAVCPECGAAATLPPPAAS